MKIAVFEARPDEQQELLRMQAVTGVQLKISSEVPSLSNAELAAGCEGVSILGQGKIDRALLQRLRNFGVKYLSTRTVGFDHIDLKAAEECGIRISNADYPPQGVADFTIMMILMSIRNYKQALWRGQVNDFALNGLMGQNLGSLTVGVMGTGHIGCQVIRELSGFGCRILCYSGHEVEEMKQYAQYVDLETLYQQCDVITLHMPVNESTYHIIDSEAIAKMKKGVVLVNCARGELTSIDALVEGIESEHIGALAMDTVEGENGIIHGDHRIDILANRNWFYLHQFRNVIITQHMAFYTQQAVESMVETGINGILQMAAGEHCRTELSA